MSTTTNIPEVGHAVRVRNRLATVRAVEPYESRDAQGRTSTGVGGAGCRSDRQKAHRHSAFHLLDAGFGLKPNQLVLCLGRQSMPICSNSLSRRRTLLGPQVNLHAACPGRKRADHEPG